MLYYVILSLKLINEFISNDKVLIFETYINKTLLGYLFNIYFITVLLLVEIYDMDYYKAKFIYLILSRYGLFKIFSSIHYFSGGYLRNELHIAYYYLKCLNPCHLAILMIRQTYLHPDYFNYCHGTILQISTYFFQKYFINQLSNILLFLLSLLLINLKMFKNSNYCHIHFHGNCINLFLYVHFGIMSDVTSYISKVPPPISYEILARFKRQNKYDTQYNTIEFTTMYLPYYHLLRHFIQNIIFFINYFLTLYLVKKYKIITSIFLKCL